MGDVTGPNSVRYILTHCFFLVSTHLGVVFSTAFYYLFHSPMGSLFTYLLVSVSTLISNYFQPVELLFPPLGQFFYHSPLGSCFIPNPHYYKVHLIEAARDAFKVVENEKIGSLVSSLPLLGKK
jgi:hypothetical protein